MADKEMFSYWVTQPELLEKSDILKLERLAEEYPYFQLAQMLLAKAVAVGQPESLPRYLPKVAVYSPSRKALQMLLENEMEWSTALLDKLTRIKTDPTGLPAGKLSPPEAADAAQPGKQDEGSRLPLDPTVLTEFALAQELLKSVDGTIDKAGEQPKTTTRELIDRFIMAAPVIGTPSEPGQSSEIEDLSLRSRISLEDFATESFAEILAKQGKTEKAIGIYEKLILKIPEKRDYFAKKIEMLKSS